MDRTKENQKRRKKKISLNVLLYMGGMKTFYTTQFNITRVFLSLSLFVFLSFVFKTDRSTVERVLLITSEVYPRDVVQ